jgi:hypothetical protein
MHRVQYRVFRSMTKSWNTLFDEAAEFASTLRERLISISHSGDQGHGIVTVWYWE